jgi:UDP-2,3-diacylglucosamine pyrophosphatase LpxH
MKTVIIGDVHGRDQWKQIVAQENDADRFVFLGDYFDSFDISAVEQMHNFKEIVEFKETSGKEVVMLIGNHDYHYFPEIDESSTSGYQTRMAVVIKQLIAEKREHLQVAHRMGEFIFSHAGISSEWLDDFIPSWKLDTMIDQINETFKYTPANLCYRSYKITDADNGQWIGSGGYGNETYQGPMWIRPKALMAANKDTLRKKIIQVVGHTYQNEIDKQGKATGGRYYFVDVQETTQEYMIITDGQISFNKTKK